MATKKDIDRIKYKLKYITSYMPVEDIICLFDRVMYLIDNNKYYINSAIEAFIPNNGKACPSDAMIDVLFNQYTILNDVQNIHEIPEYNIRFYFERALR